MALLKSISDVPGWGLCVGCGACSFVCSRNAVTLETDDANGIRPVFDAGICGECRECLSFCPGAVLASPGERRLSGEDANGHECLIGPSQGIWEGHSTDAEIRYRASSGGVVTALALYCLEKEGMAFVLHTGMAPEAPWRNRTLESRTRAELLSRAGSRYTASSPCDSLEKIEASDRPCVFVGKPCDAAAVMALRKERPVLDRKLGAVLTFFCAGTPCPQATLDLLSEMGCDPDLTTEIRYRGNGWPGNFKAAGKDGLIGRELSYRESWGFLAGKHRPFRCHICPDGLGEISDVSSGDAWHRHGDPDNPGESIVIARTRRGSDLVGAAMAAGYLELAPSGPREIVAAQGLVARRSSVFGRMIGMRLLGVPTPRFEGFRLAEAWMRHAGPLEKTRSILGTVRRIVVRGLWHRKQGP